MASNHNDALSLVPKIIFGKAHVITLFNSHQTIHLLIFTWNRNGSAACVPLCNLHMHDMFTMNYTPTQLHSLLWGHTVPWLIQRWVNYGESQKQSTCIYTHMGATQSTLLMSTLKLLINQCLATAYVTKQRSEEKREYQIRFAQLYKLAVDDKTCTDL